MTAPPKALVMPALPKHFALVLDPDDPQYEEFVTIWKPTDPVMWWGSQFDGHAVLYRVTGDGRLDTAHHRDAGRAEARWSRLYPLKLEWL
ncbi:MAG: hypothetical protein WCA46_12480 [Actinocatenispora sp.]